MIHARILGTIAGLGSVTALAFLALAASGDQRIVNGQANNAPPANKRAARADRTKRKLENSTKVVVAAKSNPATSGAFINPKVAPGKVRWHASYSDACAAAAKSKKPVLLFHMMGKLDEQFC
jgi:hypothetical protein